MFAETRTSSRSVGGDTGIFLNTLLRREQRVKAPGSPVAEFARLADDLKKQDQGLAAKPYINNFSTWYYDQVRRMMERLASTEEPGSGVRHALIAGAVLAGAKIA